METNQIKIEHSKSETSSYDLSTHHKDYRVFLSYRGKSAGKKFSEELYHYLIRDPFYSSRYGEIYYSLTEEKISNYKLDMKRVMKTVKFFVLPLTPGFFEGFQDADNSITRIEIQEALDAGSRFICIAFPGYNPELYRDLLYTIYGDKADRIVCEKLLEYNESNKFEIFQEIALALVIGDENFQGIGQRISALEPNVTLEFKSELEDPEAFPFYEKLYDVKSLTLLNYASSSFISGIDIAHSYEDHNPLKNWFTHALGTGEISVNMILTDPHSQAARDAAAYKMYPEDLSIKPEEIILSNMNKLVSFIKRKANAGIRLRIFLTQIALPYGIMMTRNKNPENNHIKVDLYAPVIEHDGKRPSFFLQERNPQTKAIYNFFKDNVIRIKNDYAYEFNGHPNIDWMYDPRIHIVHRGVINTETSPHTRDAFEKCIQARMPMEVDLLQLNDNAGTIVVGREEQEIIYEIETTQTENGLPGEKKVKKAIKKKLGDCTISDIRNYNRSKDTPDILTLDEFLNLVRGEVPLLLEIKTKNKATAELDPETERYVHRITRTLTEYLNSYSQIFRARYGTSSHGIAVHSSDYRVLPVIREQDCMIPCGIISTDFAKNYPNAKDLSDEFKAHHNDWQFLANLDPDFISYDVRELDNGIALEVKHALNIPLLAWTIKSKEQQKKASDYLCDNIIIEENINYL